MSERLKQVQKRIMDSIENVGKSPLTKKYFDFSADDLKSLQEKGTQAQVLLNCKKIMDSADMANFMKISNFGPYIPELWPIVTAWYPEFPLKELICVQGMEQPLCYMAFSQLKTGTTKAPTVAGQLVETATGMRTINGAYPTGEVQGEILKATDFQFDNAEKTSTAALVYFPLTTGLGYLEKFRVKIASTDANLNGLWLPDHQSNGEIFFMKQGADKALVTMDIQSGALTIQESDAARAVSVTEVSAYYVWDIQTETRDTIPSIEEDIILESMEARPRALGLQWSIFSEYVKKAQFGTDIRVDTTQRVLALMFQYQCRYILDTMYEYSTQEEETITIPTSNITVESKAQEVLQSLNKVGQKIALATGRMYGNRLVVGMDMRSWLESLPTTYFTPAPYDEKGYESPRKLGKFGPYEVYYDPNRATDTGFMTYRGSFWADAAYYLGEFMPIVPTDAIELGTRVRSAFCSMEAHKYHKPMAVIPIKFVV